MQKLPIYIILLLLISSCGLLGSDSDNYKEPTGWFSVLSDSLEIFQNDNNFKEVRVSSFHFLNESQGWVSGRIMRDGPNDPFIATTTDGGRNWNFQSVERVGEPYFFDMDYGYIAANVIYRTTTGGESWDARRISQNEPAAGVVSINCKNENECWAVGAFGAIAKTINAGNTWTYLNHEFGEDRFESIHIYNGHLWLLGVIDPGRLIKTTDGGNNWQNITLPLRGENDSFLRFSDVHFIDEYRGWVAGDFRHIFFTDNGGETWELQYPKTSEQVNYDAIKSIHSYDDLNLLALTSAGAILTSNNGGLTWEIQQDENHNGFNSKIRFINENVAYAVQGSKLIKTVTHGHE